MALNKAITHGKEHRKHYRGAKAVDCTCRNHGSCAYCRRNRLHKFRDKKPYLEEDMETHDYPPPNEALLSYFTSRPEMAVEMVNELIKKAKYIEDQRNELAGWIAGMFSNDAVGYPYIMMNEKDRIRCTTTEGVIAYIKENMED